VNLDLYAHSTPSVGTVRGVTLWGPFQVGEPIYAARSGSGRSSKAARPNNRAISNERDILISDCIHAVAAVDPVSGGHYL